MSKHNRRNLYRILHVQQDAPTEVIRASYRTMMQKLCAHPDRGGDEWQAAVINQAYHVLTDLAQRREYDARLRRERNGFDPTRRPSCEASGIRPSRAYSHYQPFGRNYCLFCGAQTPSGIRGYSSESRCRGCDSPQARVDSGPRRSNGKRSAQRVALRDGIFFYTDWPQTDPFAGRIIDVSPLGMQFATMQLPQSNQMIKIESRGLSAIGRVAWCIRKGNRRTGEHLVAIQFVTLAVKTRRGPA